MEVSTSCFSSERRKRPYLSESLKQFCSGETWLRHEDRALVAVERGRPGIRMFGPRMVMRLRAGDRLGFLTFLLFFSGNFFHLLFSPVSPCFFTDMNAFI